MVMTVLNGYDKLTWNQGFTFIPKTFPQVVHRFGHGSIVQLGVKLETKIIFNTCYSDPPQSPPQTLEYVP